MKNLRPGMKVYSSFPTIYGQKGIIIPFPKKFGKNWNKHFAYVRWEDGHESGEMRVYLNKI
jgi:hypothetical protein